MKKIFLLFFLLSLIGLFDQSDAQTWSATERLTFNSGNSLEITAALDSAGNIYIFWRDQTFGSGDILMKKSTDNGSTWSNIQRLTWNISAIDLCAICDTNDILHIVWRRDLNHNYEIFYKKSTNLGTSWSSTYRLTFNPGHSEEPQLMKDTSNNIYVSWIDQTYGDNDVVYKKSTNAGSSWSSVHRLTWAPGWANSLFTCDDKSGNIYLFWSDNMSGAEEIYQKKSSNGGTTWSPIRRMTWTTDLSRHSFVVVTPNDNLHIAWADYPMLNGEIFYKKSTDGGVNWINLSRLTWNSGSSIQPVIVRDGNDDLFVFWVDDTPGNSEIFLKKSTDAGVSWGAMNRLTWTSGNAQDLAAFLGNSKKIHLFWTDDSTGNFEIYYKRGTIPFTI